MRLVLAIVDYRGCGSSESVRLEILYGTGTVYRWENVVREQ